MVSWAIKDFGGTIPRTGSRNLPDMAAEQATNCDLSTGFIRGLPTPQLVTDLSSASDPPPQRAYRLPSTTVGEPDAWLALPSPYSSVMRSPLANDTLERIYWTNPNDGAYWNTYSRVISGNKGAFAPYNLGTIQPDPNNSTLTITTTGGTTNGSVALVSRSYCWTYVNEYGEESAPNAPSVVVTGPPDATWLVSGLPSSIPQNPAGMNYPTIVSVNLYRTSTGTQTGAQFYLVSNYSMIFLAAEAGNAIKDILPDTEIVNNNPLPSASWANPLPGLDGLIMLPGGMLVAFTGNTLHFCEPDHPHTWPAAYDQSVEYEIMGLAVWQSSLVVLTAGFPFTGSGNTPSNFTLTEVRVPEPCISRGSIITDLMGVYYASQNGLVMLNYFGMQNQTLSLFSKNEWLNTYNAAEIIACRHRAQYLAMTAGTGGFIIDYSEARLGVMPVSSLAGATCVWNDEYEGQTYVMSNGKVYLWDSPDTAAMTCRWRSKQFYGPAPISLGACQITLDPEIATASASKDPLFNGDKTLALPAGVKALARIFAGPDGQNLIMTKHLSLPREIFRIPSGFKAFDWQIEVVTCTGVRSIELASTMKELRNV